MSSLGEAMQSRGEALAARLFTRFQAIYGNRMTIMWGDSDPLEVRKVWADRLGQFVNDDLREALVMLPNDHPDYPPTLFQFVGLCKDARRKRASESTKLSGPRTPMPEHIRTQLRQFVERVKV